jgi:acyl carrier protein
MDKKLEEIISDFLGVSDIEFSEDENPKTISSWDSFTHMSMMIGIEQAFDLQFSDDELLVATNLKSVKTLIDEKLRAG